MPNASALQLARTADFGSSIATFSGWALVGSPGMAMPPSSPLSSPLIDAGAVYLVNIGTGRLHATLRATVPSVSARFGSAVAMTSIDGSACWRLRGGWDCSAVTVMVIVGADQQQVTYNANTLQSGAVYVYSAPVAAVETYGSGLTFERELVPRAPLPHDARFGCSIALLPDDDTVPSSSTSAPSTVRVAVGARGPSFVSASTADAASAISGAVYVFDLATGTHLLTLAPLDQYGSANGCRAFGASLAAASAVLLVGAPRSGPPCAASADAGAAFAYHLQGDDAAGGAGPTGGSAPVAALRVVSSVRIAPTGGARFDALGTAVAVAPIDASTTSAPSAGVGGVPRGVLLLAGAPRADFSRGRLSVVTISQGMPLSAAPPAGLIAAPFALGARCRFGERLAADASSGSVLLAGPRSFTSRGAESGAVVHATAHVLNSTAHGSGDGDALLQGSSHRRPMLWGPDSDEGDWFGGALALAHAGRTAVIVATGERSAAYAIPLDDASQGGLALNPSPPLAPGDATLEEMDGAPPSAPDAPLDDQPSWCSPVSCRPVTIGLIGVFGVLVFLFIVVPCLVCLRRRMRRRGCCVCSKRKPRVTIESAGELPDGTSSTQWAWRRGVRWVPGDVEVAPEPISSGSRVRIKGVTSRPALNDKVGNVLYFDAGKERYAVLVGGETISLRPECLEPLWASISPGMM